LIALKWRVLGKRVRARGQFAPLLSRSPRAYALWILNAERNQQGCSAHEQNPPIVALVATDGSKLALKGTLEALAAEGVQTFLVGENQASDISAAAAAIDWNASPWILLTNAGDRLAPCAASAYRNAIEMTDARVIYADDDLLSPQGRFTVPHFKTAWNSELFRYFDFLTGACIIRIDEDDLKAAAGLSDWAARLVATASGGGALHVPKMLHHRATRIAPKVLGPLTIQSDLPMVSVIVPTRNRVDLLMTCLEGLADTHYPNMEIIVVDNDSDDSETLAYLASLENSAVRVLRHSGPFNYSAINNRAVSVARGKLVCLLNNDIEITGPHWLAIMASQALRDDVGAVGAQLLYPDGRIQHAGVVIGVGNAAGHAHRFLLPHEEGYFRRHALPQFTSAVTAACLVIQRERFLEVGGLDEENFSVAYNDVDLCLRLNQHGWQSLYEPRAALIHHESVSRGLDLDPVGAARFAGELSALKRIWKTDQIVDPYHHQHLSRASEQFAVDI
jgi:GT2 family glycosyltransferase